jgi:hypothetical protein
MIWVDKVVELELELILSHMTQKPMLRGEVVGKYILPPLIGMELTSGLLQVVPNPR